MQKVWWQAFVLGSATLTVGLAGLTGTLAEPMSRQVMPASSQGKPTGSVAMEVRLAKGADVQPSDWAFQSLRSLVQRYGCFPDDRLKDKPLSRYEFAAVLKICLARLESSIAVRSNVTAQQDRETLKRLEAEFAGELAALSRPNADLEARIEKLESSPLPITTGLRDENRPALGQPSVAPALASPAPTEAPAPVSFEAPQLRRALDAPAQGTVSRQGYIGGGVPNARPTRTGAGLPAGNNRSLTTPLPPGVVSGTGETEVDRRLVLPPDFNREGYNPIQENPFLRVGSNPLSTFSIDVDAAAYSNMRRFINNGQLPPRDAVRLEELINYFSYDYPNPKGNRPFSITTEVSEAPWNSKHQLVHIGLQGKRISTKKLPPSNLVFLLDVSGSMNSANKLPLVKSAMKLLVEQLRPEDRVTIVVYAGAAGLVLPPTAGNEKATILDAIANLQAGGSTAGGAGIQLAYKMAQENFLPKGNNRVILATDGDFNVGPSSDAELVRMIEQKRQQGVFLSVLGFGTGNYQDAKMEQLADKGNGNYAYIDTIREARKVLVNEMGATLLTIAKDVKLQVEFNPAKVQAYRLIGYENRLLRDEDFHDDTKDAGELGAGHTVTALYEVIPVGVESDVSLPEPGSLRYQQTRVNATAYDSDELMLVQLRYKRPDRDKSKLIREPVVDRGRALEEASDNFKFSAAVAGFGLLLRDSQYKGQASFAQVLDLAQQSKGKDVNGYRAEFIELVRHSQKLVAATQEQHRAEGNAESGIHPAQ